ncbi:MAG: hypothetical protein AB1646_05815 [Thermodesulfobacteriota bacterium]
MPIADEYRDICEMLLKATEEGRVSWTEEATATFAVRLPELRFEIWAGKEELEFVAVGIRDAEGSKSIDNWYLEEGDPDFKFLKTLWSEAKRHARRIPQALERLRSLLRTGDRIGLD